MTHLHATCVAVNGHGVLLTGVSGSGKSDLALRLIDRGAQLVSDDYTDLTVESGSLVARAPATIAGLIEVRGLGIINIGALDSAIVRLHIALDAPGTRLPDAPEYRFFIGVRIRHYVLAALECSAPIKLEMMLAHVTRELT